MVIKKEEVSKASDASSISFGGSKPTFKSAVKKGENNFGYFPGLEEDISK
jgi:hypothetical protein